jgi:hypothetical protein
MTENQIEDDEGECNPYDLCAGCRCAYSQGRRVLEVDMFELRRRLMGASRRQFESAKGVYTNWLSQDRVAEILDNEWEQFARVPDRIAAEQHPRNEVGTVDFAVEWHRNHMDAQRYRWLRDQGNSLETRHRDKGVVNGPSCYHEVEGIRELKWGDELDVAVDAAIAATKEQS